MLAIVIMIVEPIPTKGEGGSFINKRAIVPLKKNKGKNKGNKNNVSCDWHISG